MPVNLDFLTYYSDTRPPENMVILLHGYGANGANLFNAFSDWHDTLPRTIFFSPNAPLIHPDTADGYMWFDLYDRDPRVVEKLVVKIQTELSEAIRIQQKKYGVSFEKTALVGFSQGAMLALATGLLSEPPVASTILSYSGKLLVPPSSTTPLNILMIHGAEDSVVPCGDTQEAYQALKGSSDQVVMDIEPGLDHTISERGLTLGKDFLDKCLESR